MKCISYSNINEFTFNQFHIKYHKNPLKFIMLPKLQIIRLNEFFHKFTLMFLNLCLLLYHFHSFIIKLTLILSITNSLSYDIENDVIIFILLSTFLIL